MDEIINSSPTGGRPGPQPAGGRRSMGIRAQVLTLAFGFMVIAVAILLAAVITSAQAVTRAAQETSSEGLRQEVAQYLAQINRGLAEQNALLLDRAVSDVLRAADITQAAFSNQTPRAEAIYTLHRGPQGQYLNTPGELASIFIPNTVISSTLKNSARSLAVNEDVEYGANVDLLFKIIKDNNPNISAVYLGTKNGVLRYYPNIRLGEIVPADFDATQRPWYLTAMQENASLAQPTAVWSPVYTDAAGLGIVTTVSIPVYKTGAASKSLIGVVGLDITLAEIRNNIESNTFTPGSYSFLLDEQGQAVALPYQGWLDLLGRAPRANEALPNLSEQVASPDVRLVLENMHVNGSGFKEIRLNDKAYFIAYSPFRIKQQTGGNTGWSLATIVPADQVMDKAAALQTELNATTRRVIFTRILPLAIIVAIILLGLAWAGTNQMVRPILKLAQVSQKLGEGQWEEPIPQLRQIEKNNSDEIGLLAHTLAEMAGQLRQSFSRLEARVAERTQELERRSLQLQTAAEISRQITLAHNLDEMLISTVNLINQRFGYYNVGIFLVDETSEYAHLRAASGDLGQKLVDQDLRLRVGQQGIVGYVTRYGQARLASDVRTDRVYQSNPLLPDTRSEVALPMRSGPKIVGALDVQSARPLAFSEDDAQVLQSLADQLAIAIENVQLVSRLQTTLQETSLLYQQQARQDWERLSRQSGLAGYEYDLLEVRRLNNPGASADARPKGLLQVPVRLREQVIGYIGLEGSSPDHQWTPDEIAIVEATANQAAQSVENARLLAETQRQAAREKLAAEVTGRMRASLDMENVLQIALQELAQRMNIAQVEVHLNAETSLEASPDSAAVAALPPRRNGDEAA